MNYLWKRGRIKVRKYSDGRWGFDDYSYGKRVMVRCKTKEKAQARATYISDMKVKTSGRPDLFEILMKNGFAPVPPPLLNADQITQSAVARVPNESGIYFIWEGSVVAYVGQSINLARRLVGHAHLRPTDKISYLCIDNSELFYHEAFYIAICRPTRNGGSKNVTKVPFEPLSGSNLT